jgi:sulfur carrier protein ThiS
MKSKGIARRLFGMKIKVKLFGTLGQRFPDYDHEQGMDVEIPDGARVKDLLASLEFSKTGKAVAAVGGRIVDPEYRLEDGTAVHLLQAGSGG